LERTGYAGYEEDPASAAAAGDPPTPTALP
jgi:hypothetical protein